jgi:hypothetical protein
MQKPPPQTPVVLREHPRSLAGDAVGPLRRAGSGRVLSIKLSRYVSECEMSTDTHERRARQEVEGGKQACGEH